MTDMPEEAKRALAGLFGRLRSSAADGDSNERVNKLQPHFSYTHLRAAAESYINNESIEVGCLVGWKPDLEDDGYHKQPPLVGIVVDIPPRPVGGIDNWKCSLMLNGVDNIPYVGEFRVMRLMKITPEEAHARLDSWNSKKGSLRRGAIPALMQRSLEKEIPVETVTFDSEEMTRRGFQRGDFIIHSHPEMDFIEIAIFGGIAADGDPKTLTFERDGSITVENPGWCCWRQMTDDELEEWGGSRREVEMYKMGLVTAPKSGAH